MGDSRDFLETTIIGTSSLSPQIAQLDEVYQPTWMPVNGWLYIYEWNDNYLLNWILYPFANGSQFSSPRSGVANGFNCLIWWPCLWGTKCWGVCLQHKGWSHKHPWSKWSLLKLGAYFNRDMVKLLYFTVWLELNEHWETECTDNGQTIYKKRTLTHNMQQPKKPTPLSPTNSGSQPTLCQTWRKPDGYL